METRVIGIDLGKSVFHLVGMDRYGKVVARKRLSRAQIMVYAARIPSCLIGMEACCGTHFLGAALVAQGHDVRLMPAQFVKPFLKSNKNDYLDAEAIAEAAQRPNMRFVPIKTGDQLDLQALHRVRDRLVCRRTVSSTNGAPFYWSEGSPPARPGLLTETDTRTARRCRTEAISAYAEAYRSAVAGVEGARSTDRRAERRDRRHS
jgi:Transposase